MAKACSECGGVGEVPEALPCQKCQGRGFIPGKPPKPCPVACDGGQVKTGQMVTCLNCQGTGREPDILW